MGNTVTVKLMVLTTEPISAGQLREALPDGVEPQNAEVMLVAPALHSSALQFWFSDADEAIRKADAVGRESLERLDEAGVSASADVGESDLVEAARDALRTFSADRIVLFSHAPGKERYREDVDAHELSELLGLPVDSAQLP